MFPQLYANIMSFWMNNIQLRNGKYERPTAMQNIIQIQLKLCGIFPRKEEKKNTNKENIEIQNICIEMQTRLEKLIPFGKWHGRITEKAIQKMTPQDIKDNMKRSTG